MMYKLKVVPIDFEKLHILCDSTYIPDWRNGPDTLNNLRARFKECPEVIIVPTWIPSTYSTTTRITQENRIDTVCVLTEHIPTKSHKLGVYENTVYKD